MSLPIIASSLSLFASLSGADMSTTFSPEIKLEANRIGIEQCGTETKQNVAFTSSMDKSDILKEVAATKPVESQEFASLPQVERTASAIRAVYQGKQAPAFTLRTQSAILPVYQDNQGNQDKQWSTAYASPERTERTLA